MKNLIKKKKCLNQRCLLNKKRYCQSPIVTEGKDFCKSEKVVSKPTKNIRTKDTSSLFTK